MKASEVERLKELEEEHARLKKVVAKRALPNSRHPEALRLSPARSSNPVHNTVRDIDSNRN